MPLVKQRQMVSWLRMELDYREGDLVMEQLELTGKVMGTGFSSHRDLLLLSS